MITQILNSFCALLDVPGATVYQMQKSEDAFKSVQANNKYRYVWLPAGVMRNTVLY